MLGYDEAPAQKRKGSRSPSADDAPLKRAKLQIGDVGAHSGDGRGDHGKVDRDGDGDGDGNGAKQGSPAPSQDRRMDGSDVVSPRKLSNSDAAGARLSPEARRPAAPPPPNRRNFSQEEKKRGQRLFGGLINTLSQTTSNAQQKRRLEIERRQQERAQQQRAEDDRRRAEKRAKLHHSRKVEQIKFDEKVMYTRHSNLLVTARSLYTRSEPRLYYRPWQLSKEQELQIEEQLRVARETIERETQDFKLRKERRLRELGVPHAPSQPETTVGEPQPPESTNRRPSMSSVSKMHVDRDPDENGDEMVQVGEEDTVLY